MIPRSAPHHRTGCTLHSLHGTGQRSVCARSFEADPRHTHLYAAAYDHSGASSQLQPRHPPRAPLGLCSCARLRPVCVGRKKTTLNNKGWARRSRTVMHTGRQQFKVRLVYLNTIFKLTSDHSTDTTFTSVEPMRMMPSSVGCPPDSAKRGLCSRRTAHRGTWGSLHSLGCGFFGSSTQLHAADQGKGCQNTPHEDTCTMGARRVLSSTNGFLKLGP